MKTIEIRQELHKYIEVVEVEKLKAIYTIMENDIKQHYDKWEDESFIKELDRRTESFLDGSAKTYTWEHVKKNAQKALSASKKRNNGI